jgi:predicted permease
MKGGRSWRPWRPAAPKPQGEGGWIVRPDPKAELDEELRFHLEQRTRDYVERGMSPESARQAAVQRFGDPARVRDACAPMLARDRASEARRTLWRVSWLDVKLGLRMFVKYPGLSLVSVTGMAVAIAIGAGYFSVLGTWLDATLPLPEGERIISIRNLVNGSSLDDASGADVLEWREALKSVRDLGAFRSDGRNISADGRTDVIQVAAISASGFRAARVAPIMGRGLVDDDERPGAPAVVIIGHEEWQKRFGGDARILDRTIRLDDTVHAIVGVMPEGFGFPVNHRYWVPLGVSREIGNNQLRVFARLADGVSMSEARAEAAAFGARMAIDSPQTHGRRRPVVLPYTHAFIGIQGPEMELMMRGFQFGIGLLLMIVAVNVAILVYARTATRMGEIAVRTALGASRARVVLQLFVEALVPSVAAAGLGLAIMHVALKMIRAAIEHESDGAGALPFLIDFKLTPAVILYVTLLAVLAAVIAGVLPALKATGTRVQHGLQQFSARAAGVQLGATWTALIVVQVAVAVAVLPAALYHGMEFFRLAAERPGPPAHGLVRARLGLSREGRAQGLDKRLGEFRNALTERLEADPEIAAITFADRFPGEESYSRFEIEGAGAGATPPKASEDALIDARPNVVTRNAFDVFEVRVVSGRGFTATDVRADSHAVIVDDTFVQRVGGNVVGRRIRYARSGDDDPTTSPWYEIVGVVPAFAYTFTSRGPSNQAPLPRVFHPALPDGYRTSTMVIRLTGSPSAQLAPRLRQIAATVDPGLRVEGVEGVVESWDNSQKLMRLVAVAIIAVMSSVLLLSAAGIYAMMSFTVARRRREIGIRAALGADARRILAGIFRRAAAQLAAGVALGLTVAAALDWLGGGTLTGGNTLLLLPSVVAVMTIVGLVAAVAPARRGLAVQPVEALRDE